MTSQPLRGGAPQTCANCGAVETDQAALVGESMRKPPSGRSRIAILTSCAVLALFALSGLLWRSHRKPDHHAAPIVDGSTEPIANGTSSTGGNADNNHGANDDPAAEAAQVATVGDTRIVTVTNPHIRIIPQGVSYEPEDLIRTARSGPPASFDTRLFRIVTPRRMHTEEGETIWLGEVVNTSTTQAAIAPSMTLTLVRGGQSLRHAEHVFPDIPPGARVPIYFSFEDSPLQFDSMRYDWKPVQAYRYGDETHPQLTTSIATRDISTGHTTVNFTREYSYPWEHVTGTITNQGNSPARNYDLYIVLRDAAGAVTGYSHTTQTEAIAPGGKAKFDNGAAQWDRPVSSVEVIALPTSPPLF